MSSTIIYKAQPEDIAKVVDIHLTCFKDSFSSSLGRRLLSDYYKSYLKHSPDLFLIAKYNDEIAGFVVGYRCENKEAFLEFKKRNRFKIILRVLLRLVVFDKRVFKKIFTKTGNETIILPALNLIEKKEKGDLLSICVLPEYRKNKIATDLEKEFNNILLSDNRKYCILSSLDSNNIANRFYGKLGYILYKKNNQNNYYIKEIDK